MSLITNNNLTPTPQVIQKEITRYLDWETATTLATTCKYFHDFFENEGVRSILCSINNAPFYPAKDENGRLTVSIYSCSERLKASHSRKKPEAVCYQTIPIDDTTQVQFLELTVDETKLILGLRRNTVLQVPSLKTESAIHVYEIKTGNLLHDFPIKTQINQAKITLDEKNILIQNEENTINYLDLQNGTILHTFVVEQSEIINCLQISPDKKYIYAGLDGPIKRWDRETGVCTLFSPHLEDDQFSDVIQISQDGTTAISVNSYGDKTPFFWDLQTGKILHTLVQAKNIKSDPISTDNRASLYFQKELIAWDLKTGYCKKKLPTDLRIHEIMLTRSTREAFLTCSQELSVDHIFSVDLERQTHQKIPLPDITAPRYLRTLQNGAAIVAFVATVTGEGDAVKFWHFRTLPEERLTKIVEAAGGCLFGHLPQGIQNKIKAIKSSSLEESINIYNATEVALPSIKKLLAQAKEQTHLATLLISEARLRLDALPASIKKSVNEIRNEILLNKEGSKDLEANQPNLIEVIEDEIEILDWAMAVFKAKKNRRSEEKGD